MKSDEFDKKWLIGIYNQVHSKNILLLKKKRNKPPRQHIPNILTSGNVAIGVQINGKTRDSVEIPFNAPQKEAEKIIFQQPKIEKRIKGKKVIRIIYIPNRILNIVTKKD